MPEWLHAVKQYNLLIYGLVLMIVLVFFPQGLFPAILQIWDKRRVVAAAVPAGTAQSRQGPAV